MINVLWGYRYSLELPEEGASNRTVFTLVKLSLRSMAKMTDMDSKRATTKFITKRAGLSALLSFLLLSLTKTSLLLHAHATLLPGCVYTKAPT